MSKENVSPNENEKSEAPIDKIEMIGDKVNPTEVVNVNVVKDQNKTTDTTPAPIVKPTPPIVTNDENANEPSPVKKINRPLGSIEQLAAYASEDNVRILPAVRNIGPRLVEFRGVKGCFVARMLRYANNLKLTSYPIEQVPWVDIEVYKNRISQLKNFSRWNMNVTFPLFTIYDCTEDLSQLDFSSANGLSGLDLACTLMQAGVTQTYYRATTIDIPAKPSLEVLQLFVAEFAVYYAFEKHNTSALSEATASVMRHFRNKSKNIVTVGIGAFGELGQAYSRQLGIVASTFNECWTAFLSYIHYCYIMMYPMALVQYLGDGFNTKTKESDVGHQILNNYILALLPEGMKPLCPRQNALVVGKIIYEAFNNWLHSTYLYKVTVDAIAPNQVKIFTMRDTAELFRESCVVTATRSSKALKHVEIDDKATSKLISLISDANRNMEMFIKDVLSSQPAESQKLTQYSFHVDPEYLSYMRDYTLNPITLSWSGIVLPILRPIVASESLTNLQDEACLKYIQPPTNTVSLTRAIPKSPVPILIDDATIVKLGLSPLHDMLIPSVDFQDAKMANQFGEVQIKTWQKIEAPTLWQTMFGIFDRVPYLDHHQLDYDPRLQYAQLATATQLVNWILKADIHELSTFYPAFGYWPYLRRDQIEVALLEFEMQIALTGWKLGFISKEWCSKFYYLVNDNVVEIFKNYYYLSGRKYNA